MYKKQSKFRRFKEHTLFFQIVKKHIFILNNTVNAIHCAHENHPKSKIAKKEVATTTTRAHANIHTHKPLVLIDVDCMFSAVLSFHITKQSDMV